MTQPDTAADARVFIILGGGAAGYAAAQSLPLNPYILGFFLGSKNSSQSISPVVSTTKPTVINANRKFASRLYISSITTLLKFYDAPQGVSVSAFGASRNSSLAIAISLII